MKLLFTLFLGLTTCTIYAQTEFANCRRLLEKEDTSAMISQAINALNSKSYIDDQDAAGLFSLLRQVDGQSDYSGILNSLILSFPKSHYLQLLKAEGDPGLGDTITFEKLVTKLILRTSKSSFSAYLLSHIYFRNGKYPLVVKTLKTGLKAFPNDYLLRTTLAEFYLRTNQGTLAYGELETALFYHKNEPYPSYLLAGIHEGSLRYTLAIQLLEGILESHPDFLPAYPALFKLQMIQKETVAAKNTFKKYQEVGQPGKTQSLQYLVLLVSYNQFEEAIEMGKQIIDNFTNEALVRKILAIAYYELKEFELCIQNYSSAYDQKAQLRSNDYQRWVSSYLNLGKEQEAIDRLKSLNDEIKSNDLLMVLADLSIKRQAFTDATSAYEQIINNSPNDAKAVYGLGRSLYYQKAYEEAVKVFLILDSLITDSHLPSLWIARSLAGTDPETIRGLAKPYYETFIEKASQNSDQLKQELIEAWSYLGYYYVVKHNTPEARKAWQQVKNYDSENKQAKEALKILKP